MEPQGKGSVLNAVKTRSKGSASEVQWNHKAKAVF